MISSMSYSKMVVVVGVRPSGVSDMAHPPKHKADPEQFARFVQAAKDLECDDREEVFEETFAKVAPARSPGEAAPSLGVRSRDEVAQVDLER